MLEKSQSDDAEAAEKGAANTMHFSSGVASTFIISDNVQSFRGFEQGIGEHPMLPLSGANVYRIFGTDGTLCFPDMVNSSYDDGKKSWGNKISMEKQEVENVNVAPFDSQLNCFVNVCKGKENSSCAREEESRVVVVCEAVRKALDGKGYGGTGEIDDFKIEDRLNKLLQIS